MSRQKYIRVIPKLDIKGPNLVKGIHLEGLRVLGKPEDFAFEYYITGADELIYIDLVASLYGRSNLIEIVQRIADKIFIPLTVGGGIRSLDDMHQLLRAGADKLAMNTALFEDISLLQKGSFTYGAQCMVVYIEAKKNPVGEYECMHTNARENSGVKVRDWVSQVESAGAGEIFLTFVDTEGTACGVDDAFVKEVSQHVDIPVVVNGGFGKTGHMIDAVSSGADAISAASMFHYHKLERMRDASKDESEGNRAFIDLTRSRNASFLAGKITPVSIGETKSAMMSKGFSCRSDSDDESGYQFIKIDRKRSVTIVDYGMGNMFSLARALKKIGATVTVTNTIEDIKKAAHIILPGVGAFHRAMENLSEENLISPIREHVKKGNPILGVCLGMQLLFSQSEEIAVSKGLDLLEGKITRLFNKSSGGCKLPHIGWNRLTQNKDGSARLWAQSIFKNIDNRCFAYFVHSFALCDPDNSSMLSLTEYGETVFCSAVQKENISGCQFHPELSGVTGLKILTAYLESATK